MSERKQRFKKRIKPFRKFIRKKPSNTGSRNHIYLTSSEKQRITLSILKTETILVYNQKLDNVASIQLQGRNASFNLTLCLVFRARNRRARKIIMKEKVKCEGNLPPIITKCEGNPSLPLFFLFLPTSCKQSVKEVC